MEDYKKKYEEALERAKSYQKWNKSAVITTIFPELVENKETKDEKIREALISILTSDFEKDTTIDGITVGEILTWLEKQNELRSTNKEEPTDYNSIDPCFGKPADKIEPKFKVRDWVVYDHRTYQIVELPQGRLINASLSRNGKTEKVPLPYCEKWSIQDAKDGDVLLSPSTPEGDKECPFIFKEIDKSGIVRFHVALLQSESIKIADGITNVMGYANVAYYTPATKEQRELLFHEMKEAGYEWNAEKKELKKIERKSIEWTEEDTNMFGSIRSTLSMYMNNLSLPKEIRDIHKEELKWLDELYDRGLS